MRHPGKIMRGTLALATLMTVGGAPTVGYQTRGWAEPAAVQQFAVDGQVDIVGGQALDPIAEIMFEQCVAWAVIGFFYPPASDVAGMFCAVAYTLTVF